MSDLQATIEGAKGQMTRSKERLVKALANTPDDKLNWAPSPTARTPLHQVAHAASSIRNIHAMMMGTPFEAATTDEADRYFRQWERQFVTRESVTNLLEENCTTYTQWLETLTSEGLAFMAPLPFRMGTMPVSETLIFPPMHTDWHTAQLEYMQTIYGDHKW